MTAPLLALPSRPAPAEGALLAATRLGPTAALLLGSHSARLPRQSAIVSADGRQGRQRLIAWPGPRTGWAFSLAIVLFESGEPAAGAGLSFRLDGGEKRPFLAWPARFLGSEAFAASLADRAAGHPGEVARFLAEFAAASAASPARAVLEAFLAAAAEEDGVVEIIGQVRDAILLQGWGAAVEAETTAILVGNRVASAPVTTATFARPDIAAPRTGVVHLIFPGSEHASFTAPALHLAAGRRLLRRPVLAEARRLGESETALHLRDMLPRLQGSAEVLTAVRSAARPVFAGRETLSTLGRPVAAAIDVAVALPGRGVFLSGWLLDPAGEVSSIALGEGGRTAVPIDRSWVRVARPDVSVAFRSDPRFAALDGDRHGFAAFVPTAGAANGERLHLALDLTDGQVGFLPVVPAPGRARATLRRAAAAVDLHKPTGLAVVERALAPLIAAAQDHLAPPAAMMRVAPKPAPTALLLALPRAEAPASALLAGFLADPPAEDEALVIVLGPEWQGAPLVAMEAALDFYRLEAGILIAEEEPEATEAWEIAARAVRAERFLCLGAPSLFGPPGWRRALARRVAGGDAAVVAPLLLYEDGSVRSFGLDSIAPLTASPYLRISRPYAGLPAGLITGQAPRSCLATALCGAMVAARARAVAGGFAAAGLTAAGQELAFFLRLAAAGGTCTVDPALVVTAPEAAEQDDGWRRPARLAEAIVLGRLAEATHRREAVACAS